MQAVEASMLEDLLLKLKDYPSIKKNHTSDKSAKASGNTDTNSISRGMALEKAD